MLKKILAIVAMLYATVAFAAVDVNKATAAELDGIKGIGPGISTKILDERKKGNFKDWNDFVERVKGVGDGNAAKFSAEGLTVNGAGFKGAAAAPAAPAAKEEKKDPKAEAKMKADEAKKAKAEEKAKKAEEAKAKKEAAKQAKAEKSAAKPAAAALAAPAAPAAPATPASAAKK
jgi:competence protein ComEA